ncbi:O-acetyl-ADP-ribose deacetylase [Dyella agri]|uniref:O-acetyl-ADP-ribose deacetylase n=1 Tax=Dyella agri TaxID=1926869 RepID=A0ABW8KHR6_9GAMM
MPLAVITADITTLAVDAIVNAANETLLGGGGVDGAIHRAAGPALLAACRALPEAAPGVRCPTGEARITPGFALPARQVIHTVGPIWRGGAYGEAQLLESCHRNAVQLAREHGLHRIAFPAISCGVYGYPASLAAVIALGTLRKELASDPAFDLIVCCYSEPMRAVFQAALTSL